MNTENKTGRCRPEKDVKEKENENMTVRRLRGPYRVKIYLAEDCAGVGTITESVKQAAHTFEKAWNEQDLITLMGPLWN